MCGIVGIINAFGRPVEEAELEAMCETIIHRGPDDHGAYVSEGGQVGLAMRRLSIIDLAGGQQPIANEDQTVWCVQNGEIYNFQELRADLISRGHTFRSSTDTEVIVHLYEEYGNRFVQHLRGMYGLAVWDTRNRRFFLARDRLGIKPIYYGWFAGRFYFGSELKALLEMPEVDRDINLSSLDYYLSFAHTPRTESIIAGIRKLEPGHLLTIEMRPNGPPKVEVSRYWQARFEPTNASFDDCVEQIREVLQESVKIHCVADVPLGAFLSGGLDSSAVVATMAQQSTRPVKTFSIGFSEADFDESSYAREVARKFGTDHHELILEPNALDVIEDIAWHLDEPFGDSSSIPTYMVSKMAAQEVTVVLSGDGGDEIFAGYEKYFVEERQRRYDGLRGLTGPLFSAVGNRLPLGTMGQRFLTHHAMSGAERYFDSVTMFRDREKRQLLYPEVYERMGTTAPWKREEQWLAEKNWLSNIQQLDLQTYLPLDILTKVDRMSMAHSIETRVPLLDHRVVEIAASMRPQDSMKDGVGKLMFKAAMRGVLPDSIIDRPKQGFAVPLSGWFRGQLNTMLRDMLLSRRAKERGIFRPAGIEMLLNIHEGGRNLDRVLWALLSFEMWARTFLDRKSVKRPATSGAIEIQS